MVLEAGRATIWRVGGMQCVEGRQTDLALKRPILKVDRQPGPVYLEEKHLAGASFLRLRLSIFSPLFQCTPAHTSSHLLPQCNR